jgi:Holliday junction resolvase RusA-like endonuclease
MAQFAQNSPLNGPLYFQARFYLPRPKGAYKVLKNGTQRRSGLSLYHTQKPDLDNLIKLVLDSCNEIVFQDDSQIVELLIAKSWCDNPIYKADSMQGVEIYCREIGHTNGGPYDQV